MDTPIMDPLLDVEAIAESKEIMGDKFSTLVGYFFEDSAMYVGQLEQAFTAGDTDALVAPAHTLKSSARQMGAQKLSMMAERIERDAREFGKQGGDASTLAPFVHSLRRTLADTLAAYNAMLG